MRGSNFAVCKEVASQTRTATPTTQTTHLTWKMHLWHRRMGGEPREGREEESHSARFEGEILLARSSSLHERSIASQRSGADGARGRRVSRRARGRRMAHLLWVNNQAKWGREDQAAVVCMHTTMEPVGWRRQSNPLGRNSFLSNWWEEDKIKLMNFQHHMDTEKKHACHPQYPAHKRIRSHATRVWHEPPDRYGSRRPLYLSASLLSPSSAKMASFSGCTSQMRRTRSIVVECATSDLPRNWNVRDFFSACGRLALFLVKMSRSLICLSYVPDWDGQGFSNGVRICKILEKLSVTFQMWKYVLMSDSNFIQTRPSRSRLTIKGPCTSTVLAPRRCCLEHTIHTWVSLFHLDTNFFLTETTALQAVIPTNKTFCPRLVIPRDVWCRIVKALHCKSPRIVTYSPVFWNHPTFQRLTDPHRRTLWHFPKFDVHSAKNGFIRKEILLAATSESQCSDVSLGGSHLPDCILWPRAKIRDSLSRAHEWLDGRGGAARGIAKWMKVLLCESGSAPAIRRQNDRKRTLLSLRLSWNCLRFSGKIPRFHFYCVQVVKYQYHAIEFSLCQKSGSTRTTSGKKDAIKHGGSSLNCGDKRARWRPQRQWSQRALQNRSGAKKHLTAHRLWLCKLSLVVTDYYPK